MKRIFAQITKVDVEKREVWGRPSGGARSRRRDLRLRELEAAVREVVGRHREGDRRQEPREHPRDARRVAAGKVIAYQFDDAEKAIDIGTKIVDDAEWKKVEEGVYTGFSIGGKYVKRWKDEATDEHALHRRPVRDLARRSAVRADRAFSMMKAAASRAARAAPYGALRRRSRRRASRRRRAVAREGVSAERRRRTH
jgi:hypothetical protein